MALTDKLDELEKLHQRGSLTDEEFSRAKERLLDSPFEEKSSTLMAAINAFRRNRTDQWIAGVCGGIAVSTGIDSWIWRLLFSLFFLCGGAGLVLYILLWIFVPSE